MVVVVVVSLCTFTRVCAEEERLHARECVPRKDWRRAREKEEPQVRRGRRTFAVHMYVLLLSRIPRMQTRVY